MSGVEEFRCTVCGKAFKTKRGLANHMRVHKKNKEGFDNAPFSVVKFAELHK